MPTMILCAGLGTRLRPLSDRRAKALMPIGDRPALAHVLEKVRPLGGSVVVNAFHRAPDVVAYARESAGIDVSVEEELLGTAGGLARAADRLGPGDVLVWNGDIQADVDVRALLAAHRAEATLAVRFAGGKAGTGNVGVSEDGRIVRLRAESTGAGEVRGGEFAGIHVLGADLRKSLPSRGCLVGDVLLPALRRGAMVRAFEIDAFRDIGTVDAYLDANLAWLAARGAPSWVGPGARVSSGVTLQASVVGAGAEVEGAGALDGCVVWPGARVRSPLVRVVVADGEIVPASPILA